MKTSYQIGDLIEFKHRTLTSGGKPWVSEKEAISSPGRVLSISTFADKNISDDDLYYCSYFANSNVLTVVYQSINPLSRLREQNKDHACYKLLCGDKKIWVYMDQ